MKPACALFSILLFVCLSLSAEERPEPGDMALLDAYHALEDRYEPDERSEHLLELLELVPEDRRPLWADLLTLLGHNLRNEFGPAVDAGIAMREAYSRERIGPVAHVVLLHQLAVAQWLSDEEEDGRASFEQAFETYRHSAAPFLRGEAARALFSMGTVLVLQSRFEEAVDCFKRVIAAFGEDGEPRVLRPVVESAHYLGICLAALEQYSEAGRAFILSADASAAEKELPFREMEAGSLLNAGFCHAQLGNYDESLRLVERLLNRFDGETEPILQAAVAKAMLDKAKLFASLDREDEARRSLEDLLARFRDSRERPIEEAVAETLFALGVHEADIGNDDAAVAFFSEVVERFERYSDEEFVARCAYAMFNLGYSMLRLDDPEAALAIFNRVIDTYRNQDLDEAQEAVARAMSEKAGLLVDFEQDDEALEVYRVLASRYDGNENPVISERALNATVALHAILAQRGGAEQAMREWKRIADEHGDAVDEGYRAQAALAMLMRANTLFELDRVSEAAALYDKMIEQFGDDDLMETMYSVCQAMYNRGALFAGDSPDYRSALGWFKRVIETYRGYEEYEFVSVVAAAMVQSAELHALLEEPEMARLRLKDLAEKVGDSADPFLLSLRNRGRAAANSYGLAADTDDKGSNRSFPVAAIVVSVLIIVFRLRRVLR